MNSKDISIYLEHKRKNYVLVQQVAIDLELCDSLADYRAVLAKYSASSLRGNYIRFNVPSGERGAKDVLLHLPTMCLYKQFGGAQITARYLLDYHQQQPLQLLADELAYPDLES